MKIISNFPKEDKDETRKGLEYYFPVIAFMFACGLLMLALAWKVCQIPDELELIEVVGEPIEPRPTEQLEPVSAPEELIVGKFEEVTKVVHVTPSEDDALAAVAMSEAGNQDVLGMAFVVMTVLNRCDYYDLTVDEVLYAPNQYSYPYYGKISHEAYRAVELAREYRDSFDNIMWFRTGTFHDFGTPAFKWGDHYFSMMED